MILDGVRLAEGSVISNLTIDSGNSFPGTAATSELFYKLNDGLYIFNGSSWGKIDEVEIPYDIASFYIGKPTADAILCRFKTPRAFTLPANLPNSLASAEVAGSSAQAEFTIKKNGTPIGTFTFAVGSLSAVFTFSADVNFVAGDLLTIVAPSVQNSTLADISFTLVGLL